MNTKNKLSQALKEAMRAGDSLRKTTLRSALSAIKYAEVQRGGELDEPTLLGIIQKEIKSRQDTIADAQKSNRTDLLEAAQAEIKILKTFLPQPLSPEELARIVQAAIAETGAASPRDMGKVMQIVMPQVKGRAEGRQVSELVRRLLSGN